MEYIIPIVLFVVVLVKVSNMASAIRVLQDEVKSLKEGKSVQGADVQNTSDPVAPSYTGEVQQAKVLEIRKNIEEESKASNEISEWFKENLILKIGVLMILVGFGWFVSYAFTHDWIGPVGRITLGIVAGSLITIFGTFRLYKNKTQGVAFTILGSAMVVMTVLAGQEFYDFFSPTMVLLIAFMVSLYVSFSAFATSLENLAVYGLLISLFAPYLSHTTRMDPVIIFFYLFIVSITTIWLSVAKNWRTTISIGVTGILLYSLPIFFGFSSDYISTKYLILVISYITAILYLIVNIYSIVKNQNKVSGNDVYLTIVNTTVILGFTTTIVPTIYQSLVIAIWMLVYAISGFLVYQKTNNEKMFFVHSLVSILLLAIATSIELSGRTLVIAFAIEAGIISIASYIVTGKIKIAENFLFLLTVPIIMSTTSFISSKWDTAVLHSDFAVLFVISLLLVVLGIFFKFNEEKRESSFQVHHLLYIIGTFYIYSIIWLSSGSIFQNSDVAVFASLFIYTVVGLVTHFTGLFKHHVVLKNYGTVLLIMVVVRLIIVDVWDMELGLRVVTFIVLGILFISTAFISKSQNKQITETNL